MKSTLTDYELIDRFVKGDHSSFEQLIYRHKNKVYAYIGMYVRDKALVEDLFQDTLSRTYIPM